MVLTAITIASAAMADGGVDSFDVLGSVMDKTKKEINTKSILKANKEEAERFREKIIKGWWEFIQGKSGAKAGEYCTATFLQAKRDPRPKMDLFKESIAVMLAGPGGDYRGALLGFMPIDSENAFPKLQKGKPVMVTLRQGDEKPVTLNAIYTTLANKSSTPVIVFAVPSIEALMEGMEDNWSFDVTYQGRSIANIKWHSGLKAREELKQCLAGKPFDNKSHLKD